MHHFIYPAQDTFVTNTINYPDANFGLDEVLRVGTQNVTARFTEDIRIFSYNTESVSGLCVENFSGNVTTGSLNGLASYISGSITGGTGSISGSGFSGSANLYGQFFSGSIIGFTGTINSFTGRIESGTISGHYSVSQSYQTELTKKYINRALVKFDVSAISESVASGDIQFPRFTLKLSVAREENLPIPYTIYAFAISQSWVMGNGYFSDGGSDKGASWNYRDLYLGNVWAEVTDPNGISPIDFINDPSLTPQVWARGGGTWYTSSIASQSFDYTAGDINMDVTNIVYSWLSGSIPNEGLILLSSDETQSTGSEMGLYFFSRDTNTIYQPRLDVGWNDSVWITGSVTTTYSSSYSGSTTSSFTSSVSSSLEPVQFNQPFVTVIQNLPPTARAGNIIRVNVFARPEFPFKNFQRRTQFTQYLTPQYLPASSYYAIKDNETDQIVVDFDNYTQVSCDVNGNYFLIDTTGLPQERYFKLLIRTEQSGSIYTFDKGDIFKIVR